MTCPPHCPLHGTPRHPHVNYTLVGATIGQVARLACGKDPDGSVRFDLRNRCTAAEAAKRRAALTADVADRKSYLADIRDSASQAQTRVSEIYRTAATQLMRE